MVQKYQSGNMNKNVVTTRENSERRRAIFEQIFHFIGLTQTNGTLIEVDRIILDFCGITREEVIARPFWEARLWHNSQQTRAKLQQAIASASSGETVIYEEDVFGAGDTVATLNLSIKPIKAESGQVILLLIEGQDTTERKQALSEIHFLKAQLDNFTQDKQAELALQKRADELMRVNTVLAQTTALLKKRNDELDQFVYVASHDLKAPLRAIANLSEWIEEDLKGQLPEENQQQIHLLRGRVHRMEALINGLLEFSRVGRIQTPSEMVNMNTLLNEVIDSLGLPATFTIEVEPQMPTFMTNQLPLQQVFSNLITNAIEHHTRLNGHVKISVQDQGQYYEFAVTDDGPGIAHEYHDKVFAIFQTLEARDRKESTGIGLAIVKKIVETEGGTIALESEVGLGSTFRFTWLKQPPD